MNIQDVAHEHGGNYIGPRLGLAFNFYPEDLAEARRFAERVEAETGVAATVEVIVTPNRPPSEADVAMSRALVGFWEKHYAAPATD